MAVAQPAPVMVHAREVRPLKFRSGVTGMQLLDVVMRRAGFGDGNVESASGAPILHTGEAVPDGHYFFTPWPKDMGVISGVITVRVRGGGVPPARFPAGGTTGKQVLQVLRGMPEFGDGTVDDALDGYCVPPSDEALKEGIYFFLPGPRQDGSALLDVAATGTRNSGSLPVVIKKERLWSF